MKLVMTLGLMNWLSDGLDKVMGAILQGIRTLFFSIDSMLYDLIIRAYDMFRLLCTGRLLNQTLLNSISERIGIILGVVMFFNVCFAFIKMLLEPDKLNDKDAGAGAIIKKSILVIVMLGMSSFVFNTLYKVQKSIVESNVISKLILPYTIEANDGEDGLDKFGNILSMELLSSFYALDSNLNPSTGEASSQLDLCKNYYYALRNQIYHTGKFDLGYNCLNTTITADISNGISSEQQEVFVIDFNWLFSAVAGGIVLYLMIMYCFKVGVRMIQLAVLEVISPMAFVSYLSPKKDTMLSKWSKIYISTYIDVFIRIAIINFVVFLIAAIFDAQGLSGIEFWNSMGLNPDTTNFATKAFLNVVIILALLTFAHKAPELIKALLPASESKLGFGASMKDIVGLKQAVGIGTGVIGGAAAGAAVGLLGGGGLGGLAGGFLKGGFSGIKGQGLRKTAAGAWKNQMATNQRIRDWKAAGGTSTFGRWGAGIQQRFGINPTQDLDEQKANLEAENAAYDQYNSYVSSAEDRAEKQILKGKYVGNTHAEAALKAKNLAEILRQQAGNLKLSDFANQAAMDAEVDRLNREAIQQETEYNNEIKVAKAEYITDSINGTLAGGPDIVVTQNVNAAQNIATTNSQYTGFAGASFSSYADIDTTNNNAKARKATNANTLYQNQNNSTNQARQANKKYSGNGK